MPVEIRLFPCLSDNYGFLVRDTASGDAAAVDTPDGEAVLREVAQSGWRLTLILNTHWHPDHTAGNAAVQAATKAEIVGPAEVRRAAPLDREVGAGDSVVLGETTFQVMATGGHTLGHVSYYDEADHVAFVGDTLFTLGCGRLLEGTPQMMWDSLQRLAQLPDDTRIYSAHEYTAANARFGLSVDDGEALRRRAETIFAARRRGEPTVPTTLREEKATNPFLRAAEIVGGDPLAAFTKLRAAKDAFKG